jgi:hypothetical protein
MRWTGTYWIILLSFHCHCDDGEMVMMVIMMIVEFTDNEEGNKQACTFLPTSSSSLYIFSSVLLLVCCWIYVFSPAGRDKDYYLSLQQKEKASSELNLLLRDFSWKKGTRLLGTLLFWIVCQCALALAREKSLSVALFCVSFYKKKKKNVGQK